MHTHARYEIRVIKKIESFRAEINDEKKQTLTQMKNG